MSELITKAAEILSKGSEIKSSFDPDKKIRKNEIFNTNEIKSKDTGYDPDKKVEKNSVDAEKQNEGYDPDKKIEKKETYNEEKIQTRNESLEGNIHPVTEVPFERKTVQDVDGHDVTGVFPVFDSAFDGQLPENLYQSTDKEQFSECNKQLKVAIEKNPELAKKFTPEQLEQIKNGDTPDGYTWHHNEEIGKMQLVDSDIHAKTGHTGGKTIWGGGNENR